MSEQGYPIHYVCTHEKAKELAFKEKRFWVSNCGCREGKGKCERSRIDVCLMFYDIGSSGSGKREITLTDLLTIFEEAESKKLVTRPFRNDKDKNLTEGICFCCDDCCGYFTNPAEICDKGELVESTNMDKCNFCGDCVAVCHFGARKMVNDELQMASDNCYGCGLCAEVCPENCVEMVKR
jgi:Pyruvate/2-oxoacid:ferredoxin oxidoreductase delta subunit